MVEVRSSPNDGRLQANPAACRNTLTIPGNVAEPEITMRILACLAVFVTFTHLLDAQATSGSVRGAVVDPSGAAVAGATIEIQNPVSHYDQT